MTKQLGELQVVFGADLKKLESALNRVETKLKDTASKFNKGFDSPGLGKIGSALDGLQNSLSGIPSIASKAVAGLGGIATTLAGIGVVLGGLGVIGLGAGLTKLISAGADLEKTRFAMAGLINATTQFTDAQGKNLAPVENLKVSLTQAKVLYEELQKRAIDLAGVTTEDLQNVAVFSLPKLGQLGITDASQQADIIGGITASLKQLNLAYSETQLRQESIAFLNGKVGDLNSTFINLVAAVNGGNAAFKANYEAAKQNGTAYEFLKESMSSFAASSALAASSLDNKFSVIQDALTKTGQIAGEQLLGPMKELADGVIKQFFTEFEEGGKKTTQFNEDIKGVSQEIGQNLGKSISGLGQLIPPVMNLVMALTRLLAAFAGSTVENNQNVVGSFGQLLNGISAFTNAAADRIGGLIKFASGAAQAGIGVIGRFGLASINILPNVANAVANTVVGVLNKMISAINGAIGLLPPAVRDSLGYKPLKAIATVDFRVKGGENIDKFIGSNLSKAGSGFNDLVFGPKSSKLPAGFFDGAGQNGNFGSKSKADPEEAKKKKGKKGKDPDVTARELANAETELAKEREKTALKEKQLAITEQELKLDQQKANFEANNERQKATLTEKQGALDIAKQQLDVEDKRIQTEVNAGRITKSQGIELSRQNDLKKQSIDYQKDLLEYEKKKVEIAEATTNAAFNEAENNKKAASAKEKLDSIDAQIANQEKLIVDPSIQKDSARVLKEKAELEKLKQARIDARAELEKIESTIATATTKDLAIIEAKTKEANTFKSAVEQKNSIDVATINQDAAAKQAADTKERAKTFQKALETGGKNIYQQITSAFEDGKITLEEAFQIGETIFTEFGNVLKALNGGGNGASVSGAGGLLSGLGGIFSLFGGGSKSGGGSGPSFGTSSKFYNASKGEWQQTGLSDSITSGPEAGGGLGGAAEGGANAGIGVIGMMGPYGAAAAAIIKVGMTIGKTIFGFIKKAQDKKAQKAADAFKARTDATLAKLKQLDDDIDAKQTAVQVADSAFLASTANGYSSRIKATKDLYTTTLTSITERRKALDSIIGDFDGLSKKAKSKARDGFNQTIDQIREQIKQLEKQAPQLLRDIDKLYTDLGKSLLDFNNDVYFSGFDKGFRDLGKSVNDVLQKGADLIEGGFDKSGVKTLVTNQLNDIQNETIKSLDDAVSNAITNRKQFLADKIKALSDSISGILKKFGFEKEDTADSQIQKAIANFNKEKQKQEADLLKAEKDAIDNRTNTLSFLNDVIARNLASVADKNAAGSTEQFLKNLGQSFAPSTDGLQEAGSILQQAVSASIDQSLKQIVTAVRS